VISKCCRLLVALSGESSIIRNRMAVQNVSGELLKFFSVVDGTNTSDVENLKPVCRTVMTLTSEGDVDNSMLFGSADSVRMYAKCLVLMDKQGDGSLFKMLSNMIVAIYGKRKDLVVNVCGSGLFRDLLSRMDRHCDDVEIVKSVMMLLFIGCTNELCIEEMVACGWVPALTNLLSIKSLQPIRKSIELTIAKLSSAVVEPATNEEEKVDVDPQVSLDGQDTALKNEANRASEDASKRDMLTTGRLTKLRLHARQVAAASGPNEKSADELRALSLLQLIPQSNDIVVVLEGIRCGIDCCKEELVLVSARRMQQLTESSQDADLKQAMLNAIPTLSVMCERFPSLVEALAW